MKLEKCQDNISDIAAKIYWLGNFFRLLSPDRYELNLGQNVRLLVRDTLIPDIQPGGPASAAISGILYREVRRLNGEFRE